jgi:uncharacterized membrane protein YkvA (DUF1232 family)
MTTKSTFEETMTKELSDFIQIQARALSLAHLDQLIVDFPVLRERFTKIPSQTYAHLSDQLEFLSLFVEEQVAGLNPELDTDPVAEAAFALLYFQHAADLIPDSIPAMGLLDDAIIVGLVLRRHDHAFKHSSHAYKLHWPAPSFGVDQLQFGYFAAPAELFLLVIGDTAAGLTSEGRAPCGELAAGRLSKIVIRCTQISGSGSPLTLACSAC